MSFHPALGYCYGWGKMKPEPLRKSKLTVMQSLSCGEEESCQLPSLQVCNSSCHLEQLLEVDSA